MGPILSTREPYRPAFIARARERGREAKVGASWTGAAFATIWNPFVGAAVGVYHLGEIVPFPSFGNDTVAYMDHIDNSIDALFRDVVNDAKGLRTEICLADLDAKGLSVDARAALICAGITSPTSDQISRMGACVVAKKAGSDRLSRTDLAACADSIAAADGLTPKNKSHTDAEWRQAFSYWMQDWNTYHKKHIADVPGYRPNKEDLDTWYSQLEGKGGWRDLFTKLGGKTITPAAPRPEDVSLFGIPTWAYWVGGGVLAFILIRVL